MCFNYVKANLGLQLLCKWRWSRQYYTSNQRGLSFDFTEYPDYGIWLVGKNPASMMLSPWNLIGSPEVERHVLLSDWTAQLFRRGCIHDPFLTTKSIDWHINVVRSTLYNCKWSPIVEQVYRGLMPCLRNYSCNYFIVYFLFIKFNLFIAKQNREISTRMTGMFLNCSEFFCNFKF